MEVKMKVASLGLRSSIDTMAPKLKIINAQLNYL